MLTGESRKKGRGAAEMPSSFQSRVRDRKSGLCPPGTSDAEAAGSKMQASLTAMLAKGLLKTGFRAAGNGVTV